MMEKTERGLMVMKDGKAWGIAYEDGQVTVHDWIDPVDAPMHDPEFCKSTTDVTYTGSPYINELMSGELVMVERKTTVRALKGAV